MTLDDETPAQTFARHQILRADPHKYVKIMSGLIFENPQDSSAYFARHQGFIKLGEPEKALRDLDMSISLKPHFVDYRARGQLLAKLGRHREALQDYAKAEEMCSPSEWTDCWGPLYQAGCHARLGHEQEALAACARLKEDHWTPGLDDAPGGNKHEVIEEVRRRVAAAQSR